MNEPREVVLVNIPDNKEALYIDGQLVLEANWISQNKMLEKLIERGIVRGGKRYADESTLNDVGQFPRQFSEIAKAARRFVKNLVHEIGEKNSHLEKVEQ